MNNAFGYLLGAFTTRFLYSFGVGFAVAVGGFALILFLSVFGIYDAHPGTATALPLILGFIAGKDHFSKGPRTTILADANDDPKKYP